MNVMTIVGVVLIVLGAVGLIYGGITYSSKTSVVDLGSLKIQADQKQQISLPPILSGVAVVVGIALVVVGRRKPSR